MLLLLILLFFGVILADALGVFDDSPYLEIPHGNHTHYVPKDCGADVDAGTFPTQRPGPGERISCDGRIVQATE